jgi:hypothetical protein
VIDAAGAGVDAPGPNREERASDAVAELSLAIAAGVGEKKGSLDEDVEAADEDERKESKGDAVSPAKKDKTDDAAEAEVDREDGEDDVSEENRMGKGMSDGRSAEETSELEESLPALPRFSRRLVDLTSFFSLDDAGESHSQFVDAKSEEEEESNVTLVKSDFCCSSGLFLAPVSDGGAKLSNLMTDASMLICALPTVPSR